MRVRALPIAAALLVASCGGEATSPNDGLSKQTWRISALSFWDLSYWDTDDYLPERRVCELVTPNDSVGPVTLEFLRIGDTLTGTASAIPFRCRAEREIDGILYSDSSVGVLPSGTITGHVNGDSLRILGPVFDFNTPWQIVGVVSQAQGKIDMLTGTFCMIGGAESGYPCPKPTQIWGGVVAMMRSE